MKKWAVCILILLLTGCSENRDINAGMELRSKMLQSQQCSFSVAVSADFGQQICSFAMDCTADEQGNVRFIVTEPESISGITGKLSSSGGVLTFDGTALDFGYLADDQLSPVSAPWILISTLRSGCITSACREEEHIRLSMDDSYEENALHLDIWLDGENLPSKADVLQDGRRVLSLDVKNFIIM